MAYSNEVLAGIEEHSGELDEKIKELAIGWSIEIGRASCRERV